MERTGKSGPPFTKTLDRTSMARVIAQVLGAIAATAFLVGGVGALVLQVSGLPRRAAAGVLYGGPAMVMGLALISFAAFLVASLCLPQRLLHLRELWQTRSLLAFGGFFLVACIWGLAQRAV